MRINFCLLLIYKGLASHVSYRWVINTKSVNCRELIKTKNGTEPKIT